jgi:hypothetical protein
MLCDCESNIYFQYRESDEYDMMFLFSLRCWSHLRQFPVVVLAKDLTPNLKRTMPTRNVFVPVVHLPHKYLKQSFFMNSKIVIFQGKVLSATNLKIKQKFT